MNNCFITFFGLKNLVEHNDCQHCPFKERAECKKAHDKVLEKAREHYNDFMKSKNRKDRRKFTHKEKVAIFDVFKHEEMVEELGAKLSWKRTN